MSHRLIHPNTAEQRMLLGIAELLVGRQCRLFYVWPACISLAIDRRWGDEDEDDFAGAAWRLGTFASSFEIRDEAGTLIRSSDDEDDKSEQAAKALVMGRRIAAVRVSWPVLTPEVDLEGGVLISVTPEDEDDPDLYYWEIETPEEPRRSLRAGQGPRLRLEPSILGPEPDGAGE